MAEKAHHVTDFALPKIFMSLVTLVCLALQGCALNSVRETRLGGVRQKTSPTRIVYGIGLAYEPVNIPFSVTIEQYDPVTGKGGDCSRWNRASAEALKTPNVIAYHVFNVPPGAYTYAWSNLRELADRAAFMVRKGETVYIGDYILTSGDSDGRSPDGIVQFRRDLAAAKSALGTGVDVVELAPTIPNAPKPLGFVCTP